MRSVTTTDRTPAQLLTKHPAGLIIDGRLAALCETPEVAEMIEAALTADDVGKQVIKVIVHEAEDLPGQWIAMWINRVGNDALVSQGNSKAHALRMLADAIDMVEAAVEEGLT